MLLKRSKEKRKLLEKLKRKYKLVLMDAETFEEKISFKLTRFGVMVVTGTTIILLILSTIYLVAFTSLRKYIPGYTDVTLPKKIYDLQQRADSLEAVFRQKDLYITNLKRIIDGKEVIESQSFNQQNVNNYDNIKNEKSKEDSLLRLEYEKQNKYSIYQNQTKSQSSSQPVNLGKINFFPPINGIVTTKFSPKDGHFGIDVVATKNEAIKATLDGIVIFSDWTIETGYTITLQHQSNIISVYKHNSSLLKKQGTFVKAGETIAIIGESGEFSTGPHLHFELWHNGKPINPEDYLTFQEKKH